MFNRILIPLDGSESSESILAWVVPLAAQLDAEIILTTVVDIESSPESPDEAAESGRTPDAPEAEAVDGNGEVEDDQVYTAATRYLADIARQRIPASLSVTSHVIGGDPKDRIIAEAIAVEADLIAMGTHRASPIARGVLGSIADRVLRTSPIPVFLLRPGNLRGDLSAGVATPQMIENIVVPMDLATGSTAGLEAGTALATAVDARLRLITATSEAYVERPSIDSWHGRYYDGGQLRADARDYLEPFVTEAINRGINAEAIATSGNPARAIIRTTRDEPGSIVVMASSGLSRFRRWMIGSVTDKVVRGAECPVLVLPYIARPAAPEADSDPLTVGDIMTSPAITTTPDKTLGQAARLMIDHRIGSLPVVDEFGIFVGIITDNLFFPSEWYVPFSRERMYSVVDQSVSGPEGFPNSMETLRHRPVQEIMLGHRSTVSEDTKLTEAVKIMMRDSVSHLPVLKDGAVIGIVAFHDMLRLVTDDYD
ncbi:MAG: universal stress protein [Dehalococcoidia bacterium]|nr:universal stress protein [Dehalococcoidia bacterium]